MAHLWFYYALAASVLWGLCYTLESRLLVSGIPAPFIIIIQGFFLLLVFSVSWVASGDVKTTLSKFAANKMLIIYALGAVPAIIGGRWLMLKSISLNGNPTLSGLVEIAYPVFIFLFMWLLFREVTLTWATALGAFLIFSGITVIYLKT